MVAAHRAGLVDEVLNCFSDIDTRTFAGMVKSLTTTHLVHAKRRMEEMDKAQEEPDRIGDPPTDVRAHTGIACPYRGCWTSRQ